MSKGCIKKQTLKLGFDDVSLTECSWLHSLSSTLSTFTSIQERLQKSSISSSHKTTLDIHYHLLSSHPITKYQKKICQISNKATDIRTDRLRIQKIGWVECESVFADWIGTTPNAIATREMEFICVGCWKREGRKGRREEKQERGKKREAMRKEKSRKRKYCQISKDHDWNLTEGRSIHGAAARRCLHSSPHLKKWQRLK